VELLAGIGDAEAPFDLRLGRIPHPFPRGNHLAQFLRRGDPAVEALPDQDAELQLRHVQPAPVLRREVELQTPRDPPRLLRRERLV
jgi:hypothetical protein